MSHAIFNGKIIDISEAQIPVADKGYFFDFAVYSSLKVVQGKIFFPDYHASRLLESARLIGLDHQFKQPQIVDWLKELVEIDQLKDALLRIVLIGDPDKNQDAKLYIFSVGGLTFYPDKFYKHGAKVITYQGQRRVPNSKTKDLLMSFLAYREAKENGALDALLVDKDGNIREGTRTNFFAIKGDVLITPPDEQVLSGIARKIVLEVASKDFQIKFENIRLDEIKNYDEFFISSTSMNVMPVREIDDLVFDSNFEKTRQIAGLFKEYYNVKILNT